MRSGNRRRCLAQSSPMCSRFLLDHQGDPKRRSRRVRRFRGQVQRRTLMHKPVDRQGRLITVECSGVTVTRLGVNLGAEISGVDLRQPVSDEAFNVIQNALVEHELIIFRNQEITSDNLIDFGRRFGELTVHPFAPHDEKASVLIKFRNDENNPPFATDVWHSDETFRSEPPMATILCAKWCRQSAATPCSRACRRRSMVSAGACSNSYRGWRPFTIGNHLRGCLIILRKTARAGSTLSCCIHRSSILWCAFILSRVAKYCSSTLNSPSPS